MRISDGSSDVCSSDLRADEEGGILADAADAVVHRAAEAEVGKEGGGGQTAVAAGGEILRGHRPQPLVQLRCRNGARGIGRASCRERVCQYVYLSGGAVEYKKKARLTKYQEKEP